MNADVNERLRYAYSFLASTFLLTSPLFGRMNFFEAKSLVETKVSPADIRPIPQLEGGWFIDFGGAAFGTFEFQETAPMCV